MKTVSFCNQKGGVSKSTSAAETAALLADGGRRVLAIDLDPQGNLSDIFGAEASDAGSSYEVLRGDAAMGEAVLRAGGVDLLPSDISLAMLEPELAGVALGREQRLRRALSQVEGGYDLCVVDCPPSLGLLVTMALTASDWVVIPTTPSFFSSKGVLQLAETVRMVQAFSNPGLEIAGILFSKYHANQVNSRETLALAEAIADGLGCGVFPTRIRESVEVEYAHNASQAVCRYNPGCKPAEDYAGFVGELLAVIGEG